MHPDELHNHIVRKKCTKNTVFFQCHEFSLNIREFVAVVFMGHLQLFSSVYLMTEAVAYKSQRICNACAPVGPVMGAVAHPVFVRHQFGA